MNVIELSVPDSRLSIIGFSPGGKIFSLMSGKSRVLLICFIVLTAIIVLASSLHDVHLQPGRPLSFDQPSEKLAPLPTMELASRPPLIKVLLFWLASLVMLLLTFYLLPPELRKRIMRQVFSLAVSLLALLTALRYGLIHLPDFLTGAKSQPPTPQPGLNESSALPVFHPPQFGPWMTFILSWAMLAAAFTLLWFFYRWWRRSYRIRSPLSEIAGIARTSLRELASGRIWSDVIVQSYVRMNEAVGEKRGLLRPEAATAREFERRLEQAGLPAEAVRRLTRLFESVRYGSRASSRADVDEAVACLNSIVAACEVVG